MLGLAGERSQTWEQEQALLEGEPLCLAHALLSWPHCLHYELAGFEAEQACLHEWPWLRSGARACGVVHLMQNFEPQPDAILARLLARDHFLLSQFPGLHVAFLLPLLQLFLLLLDCVSSGF